MSKTIYIGDIHGRDVWNEIVAKHDDADNIVFIGDYFDSFDIPSVVQLDNVKKIVEFKKKRELDTSKKGTMIFTIGLVLKQGAVHQDFKQLWHFNMNTSLEKTKSAFKCLC